MGNNSDLPVTNPVANLESAVLLMASHNQRILVLRGVLVVGEILID